MATSSSVVSTLAMMSHARMVVVEVIAMSSPLVISLTILIFKVTVQIAQVVSVVVP